MPWELDFTEPALKTPRQLPKEQRRAIGQALDQVERDPSRADIHKLSGERAEWRLRVGDWRVLLTFDTRTGTILVRDVRPPPRRLSLIRWSTSVDGRGWPPQSRSRRQVQRALAT